MCGLGVVNKGGLYALFSEGVGKQVVRSAVDVGCGDDVISGMCNILHRVGYSRRAGCQCQGSNAALQSSYALLKHV